MTVVRIERNLNLIIELPRENYNLYVHSAAISTEVFESTFFDLIGPMTPILARYGPAAPRYAALVLRQVAFAALDQLSDRPDLHERAKAATEERITALFNELRRLTYVIAPKDGRFDMVLVDDAKAMGVISAEELSRIDSALAYFTWGSQSGPLESAEALLGGLGLYSARTESLNCTGFIEYLTTLTRDANSGVSPDASPLPSTGSPPTASAPSSPASMSPNFPGEQRRRTGIVITRQQ